MPLQTVRHISVGIARPLAEAYVFLAEPENFPQWASGLGDTFRHIGGMEWSARTPMGVMKLRFSKPNPYGILDHCVVPEGGDPMHNPMRVFANGDGCEVVFALIQRPGMSDADFARDADWVAGDLAALKVLLEG